MHYEGRQDRNSDAVKEPFKAHVKRICDSLQRADADLFLAQFQIGQVVLSKFRMVSQHLLTPTAFDSQIADSLTNALTDVSGHPSRVVLWIPRTMAYGP